MNQIVNFGLKDILSEIVLPSFQNKSSFESTKSLIEGYGEGKEAELAMAIIEMSAVCDGAVKFCQACYQLEGDSPLIFTAARVLTLLTEVVDTDNQNQFPTVEKNMDTIMSLFNESKEALTHGIDGNRVQSFTQELNMKKEELEKLKKELEELETVPGQNGGRRRKKAQKNINTELTLPIKDKIVEVKESMNIIRESREEARNEETEKTAKLNEWKDKFPYNTEEEIGDYAATIVRPCTDYYVKHFIDEDGDLFRLHNAAKAATLFDPLTSKDMTIIALQEKVKALTFFEHDKHFNQEFLAKMHKEVSRYREKANEVINWDAIKPSKQYKTRLQRCMKRRKLNDDHQFDWKNDPGERACRIWEWWKTIDESELPCFKFAVRIVAICQVSSCAVERVFSQLKMINDACGIMYEDMLEVRMFCRTNGEGLVMKFKANATGNGDVIEV